jgi:hypothetical protein
MVTKGVKFYRYAILLDHRPFLFGLVNVRASTSGNHMGLLALLQGYVQPFGCKSIFLIF